MAENSEGQALFKYRAFNLNSITDLAHNRLFFADPRIFNDAYDCKIPWDEILSAEEVKAIATGDFSYSKIFREFREERPDCFDEGWQLNRTGYFHVRSLLEHFFDEISTFGVCSLSATLVDQRLWGHYGGSRTGFAIGFHRTGLLENAVEVKYSDDLREIRAYDVFTDQFDAGTAEPFLTGKSEAWRYEREFRILYPEHSVHLNYEPTDIQSITFGDLAKAEHVALCDSLLPEHVEFSIINPIRNSYDFVAIRVDRSRFRSRN